MRHLTPAEFTDLLDGVLPPARQAHVASCASCRDCAETVRRALAGTAGDIVPEPSPLFWEHFQTRVRKALEGEPTAAGRPWRMALRPAQWAGGVVVAAVLVAAAAWQANRPPVPAPSGVSSTAAAASNVAAATQVADRDIEIDEDWALVRAVADEVAWEDAHAAGITVRPGSTEALALELSEQERAELARLLEHELKRAGA